MNPEELRHIRREIELGHIPADACGIIIRLCLAVEGAWLERDQALASRVKMLAGMVDQACVDDAVEQHARVIVLQAKLRRAVEVMNDAERMLMPTNERDVASGLVVHLCNATADARHRLHTVLAERRGGKVNAKSGYKRKPADGTGRWLHRYFLLRTVRKNRLPSEEEEDNRCDGTCGWCMPQSEIELDLRQRLRRALERRI